ncbi:MAG: sensor histidine kinase [Ktedonobacteraceae bacterium]
MAYTKPENYIDQLQTNQRKPASVQISFWRHSQVGYLVCLPLVGLALLGSLLEQQLGLHAYFSSAPFLLAVVFISLLWGTGPALLAILGSMLVLDYMYVPPTGSFDLHTWDGLLQVLPFILSGALIAIITAQRETARRRALEAEQEVSTYADKLELNNRLQGEAIVQAGRELNTSLNSINQQVHVLQHHLPVQREQASYRTVYGHALEQITLQTRHLQSLNTALISVEKDQTNETDALLTPYDLCAVCRTLLADSTLYQGRNIVCEVPSHPIMVQIDREDLKQVMVNVVRHALKHSSPDGIVQVCISQDKEHVHITVSETGAKQTQIHLQDHVGSRHIDLHPVSKDDGNLWFVICQTIVEWYNGRIRYTVSSDDESYTCSIDLPAS